MSMFIYRSFMCTWQCNLISYVCCRAQSTTTQQWRYVYFQHLVSNHFESSKDRRQKVTIILGYPNMEILSLRPHTSWRELILKVCHVSCGLLTRALQRPTMCRYLPAADATCCLQSTLGHTIAQAYVTSIKKKWSYQTKLSYCFLVHCLFTLHTISQNMWRHNTYDKIHQNLHSMMTEANFTTHVSNIVVTFI